MEHLDLRQCKLLTTLGLKCTGENLTKLKYLDFQVKICDITDEHIFLITNNNQNLENICVDFYRYLTSQSFKYLGELSRLKRITYNAQ